MILDYPAVLTDTTHDFPHISNVGLNVTDFGSRCLTFRECRRIPCLVVNSWSEKAVTDASTIEGEKLGSVIVRANKPQY